MWRATTKPSSAQRFLNWYSRNLSAGSRAEDGTAVYTFSPAKYAVDNAASGTAQRPGTPTANIAVWSGNEITNSMVTKNVPRRTLPMMTSKGCSYQR